MERDAFQQLKEWKNSKGKFSEETLPAYASLGKLYFTKKEKHRNLFITM